MSNRIVVTVGSGVEASATIGDGIAVSARPSEGVLPLNGTVTTPKLADGAVTTRKIADFAVTRTKIADGAISDDKLSSTGVLLALRQLQEQVAAIDPDIDPDDLGLEQDDDTKYVYPTYKGIRSANGIPLAASGGSGGGGSGNAAVLTVTNTTGWLSTTTVPGSGVNVSVTWSSIEDGNETGDGSISVTVGTSQVWSRTVAQGAFGIDVSPYLAQGTNRVKVRVSDVYGNARVITFTVSLVNLSVASSFDDTTTYPAGEQVAYTYVPVGAMEKTVHFEVDGTQVATATVLATGRQQTQQLPAMAHGAHTLRVWFTADVNGTEVSSNVLTHVIAVVAQGNTTPVVAIALDRLTATQYETVQVPYSVFTPNSLTSQVSLEADGEQVTTLTVDRTRHVWAYRVPHAGTLTLTVRSGRTAKSVTLEVEASDMDVEAETESLALHMQAQGRSNAEADPSTWGDKDRDVYATLTGFDFSTYGWVLNEDGATVLRVGGGARATIPYRPFASDWRGTGKTVEVEFATRGIRDYDATVISCMSGGRGFEIGAQLATLRSELTSQSVQYRDGEHVRIAFVCEKRSEDRLLYTYVNGIMSGIAQYPENDNFAQVSPAIITIGSDLCDVDIYHIRVYDNDLTRQQVLDNWIADSPSVNKLVERYNHNDVYDEYGQVSIEKLPVDLPYMVIECAELPQYKGDKKTCSGSFVDPQDASKSFTFSGCQINVQGTSSATYARKNYDMQFKNGFEMTQSGIHADSYQLDASVKPFDRFVLKADVASSEGANNVELAKLYNDASPYRKPSQSDPLVRWGIWGRPAVLFWRNTDTNATSFVGRVNFNFPKRAPAPYGYSGDMESWEFQNNTSDLMLFKTDHFDETPMVDPATGEAKASWRYDYEARFPSDEWTNYAKLQELQSFVVSCDRSKATGDALATAYTDADGNTHATDDAAYRLAKFRTEFGDYAEVQSFLFYYIFTELFLMVDSRAKNLFIGFAGGATTGLSHIDRKAIAEPYDMDTSIGTNNEGALVFGYSLEDTDHLASGANVFNGQDSVLWCNVRDAFPAELSQMYQALRSAGTLSYATVEGRFEEHQAKWPEAIFNEDAQFKYIDPLTNPEDGKEPTAVYLAMAQGSKAEQRKWWLYNRFRYMDSKWNAGDALSDVIQLRGYAKANITVTPYADIYPAVKYGSYYVSERGSRGTPTTLVCPLSNVNDTEIYVYSASQLSSVGDLSGLKVGFADFSRATRLQSVKVGSDASGYENQNLTELHVGTNRLLATVDARNCTALATQVDFSGATALEHVLFEGTAVPSVTLPQGGTLRTLHLPSTVTNLTVIGQSGIESFVMPDYSSITTLRIEGCGDAIPYLAILDDMPQGSRVRIVGLEMEVTTADEVEDLYDLLDLMVGMDEYGVNTERAQVSGTITGVSTATNAWIAQMALRYPYITVNVEEVTTVTLTVRFFDGETLLETHSDVAVGSDVTYGGAALTKEGYTFTGWSDDTSNVVENMDVYAVWHAPTEISDSLAQIIAATNDGTYASKYFVGDTKEIDLGANGTVVMELVAKDMDILASDTTKTVPTTWIAKQLLAIEWDEEGPKPDWTESDIRTYLNTTVRGSMPSILSNAIKTVRKYTQKVVEGEIFANTSSSETIWIPSLYEVNEASRDAEWSGPTYRDAFPSNDSRRRARAATPTTYEWWYLRTTSSVRSPVEPLNCAIRSDGAHASSANLLATGLVIGFCI